MKNKVFVFLLIECIHESMGFFPHSPKDGNANTRTHGDITAEASFNAISRYITDRKGFSSIEEFYKTDAVSRTKMVRSVIKLKAEVADTQYDKRNTAYFHCNADQILLAHTFVKSCKNKLHDRKSDINHFVQQLGQCLYVLQSFYSNTNWVELKGSIPYEDFGIGNLMDTAEHDEDTCTDIGNSSYGCQNNIIVNNKLTSGYHSNRLPSKPSKPLGSKTGKCSHGGPEDSSKEQIAKCGINKDSVTEEWSPHFHLHEQAYQAAIKATENYFMRNGTGVLETFGETIFENLFYIKRRKDVSLAIAIDYTYSMTDDIAAVKDQVIRLLTSLIGSPNEPVDYVLSLIHDPESWNKVFVFSNGYDMIQKIQALHIEAGVNFDCPEYSAAGMLAAIEKARNHSKLLVFTDADAKDAYRMNEVIEAANAKNISVTSLLTNQCPSKRKRSESFDKARQRRETLSFFERIAAATGGSLHQTSKTNLGNVLNEVLQEIFPSTEVIIDEFRWPVSKGNQTMFSVDSTISVLKINVIGASSNSEVELLYQNGTLASFEIGTYTKLFTDKQESILSIQHPPLGYFKLQRKSKIEWQVNITAQSTLTAEMNLLMKTEDGNLARVQGSPISGKLYVVSVNMYDANRHQTVCSNISFVSLDGEVIVSKEPVLRKSAIGDEYTIETIMPSTEFQIAVFGKDEMGIFFRREFSEIFAPTNVELTLESSEDDVIVGCNRSIRYIVRNLADVKETYKISLTSSIKNIIQGSSSTVLTVLPSEEINGTFIIMIKKPSVIFSYTIKLMLLRTNEVEQTITKSLVVTAIPAPQCFLTYTHGTCETWSLNTANCSFANWTARAEVNFSGTTIISITSTAGKAVSMKYDDIRNLQSGPLHINISGTCCNPESTISIIDQYSNIAQCYLDFSSGVSVKSVENVISDNMLDRKSTSKLVMIIAICVPTAVLLIAVGIVGMFILVAIKNQTSVQDIRCRKLNRKENGLIPKKLG